MVNFDSEINNCKGYKILEYLPWNLPLSNEVISEDQKSAAFRAGWGFMICCPPTTTRSVGESDSTKHYGITGPIQYGFIQNPCFGIQIEESDPKKAISILSLACGLSIIDTSGLEIGDMVVVTGANILTFNIVEAAFLQGVRAMCLVPTVEVESIYFPAIQKIADTVIEFQFNASFNSEFEKMGKSTFGKVVYIDATGIANLNNYLVTKLQMFGRLILCRQDLKDYFPVDIYRDVHLKSAQISYWAWPATLFETLEFIKFCQRATELHHLQRLP